MGKPGRLQPPNKGEISFEKNDRFGGLGGSPAIFGWTVQKSEM